MSLYLCVMEGLENVVAGLGGWNSLATEAVSHPGLWLVTQRSARPLIGHWSARLLIGHWISPTVSSIPAKIWDMRDIRKREEECHNNTWYSIVRSRFVIWKYCFRKVLCSIDFRYWKRARAEIWEVGRRSKSGMNACHECHEQFSETVTGLVMTRQETRSTKFAFM